MFFIPLNLISIFLFFSLFFICSSLKSLPDISKWNTKNVSNMDGLFCQCSSLKSLPDISRWNTKNVTDMSMLFSECSSLLYLHYQIYKNGILII